MKKLFTLLTLLVFLGGGKSWGQTYKNDFTNGQIFWTTQANVDAAANTETPGYWMVKGGNLSSTKNLKDKLLIDPSTDEIATTAPYTSTTNFYVEKTYNATASKDVSLYLYVTGVARIFLYAWCNSTPDGRTLDITVNGEAKGSISFATGTANAQYTSVILTKSANNIIRINGSNEVELTAIKVETVEKSVSTLAFTSTSGNADMADGTSFTLPSLTKTPADATVTYSSSDESVATVNASTGAVTLVAPGETTITASYAGNASYYPSTATYTLTVVNTAANNITVSYNISEVSGIEGTAPANFNIDEGKTFNLPAANQTLYVAGKTLTGWTDGTNNYNLGASVTAPATDMTIKPLFTANAAEAYLGHNASTVTWNFKTSTGAPTWALEGAGCTDIYVTQATIGSNKIDVKLDIDATSGKFNNASNENYVQITTNTKLTVPVIKDAIVKLTVYSDAANPTFNGNAGEWDGTGKIYSYTATADGDLDIVYGGNDWASKLEVIYPSETAVLTISSNDTKVGLTQTNIESVDYVTVSPTDKWGSNKTYATDYTGNFFNMSNGRTLTMKVTGAKTFIVYVQNDGNADRSYKLKIGTSDEEIITCGQKSLKESDVYELDPTATTSIVLTGNGDSVYPVYFHFNPTNSITIGEYEWATYVSDKALDFTGSDVKAYIITGHVDNAITKSDALNTVPANTPLLLNAPEGNYAIPHVASSSTDVSANLLVAGDGNEITAVTGKTRYVLGVESEKATFLKIVGTAATVPTNKAYLEFDEEIAAREFLDIDIDGVSTGIKNMKVGSEDNVYYDLQGRRVLYPTKGLYIVNGKKVVIK